MNLKLVFLLFAASQVLANSPTGGARPRVPAMYMNNQIDLVTSIEEYSENINQLKATFEKQTANQEFQNPQVNALFKALISQLLTEVKRAKDLANVAARILADLRAASSSVPDEWFQPILQLQHLSWFSLISLTEGVEDVKILISQMAKNQKLYSETKERQMNRTKEQLEENQRRLEGMVKDIGMKGVLAFNKAENEWSRVLRTQLGSAAAQPEIQQIRDILSPVKKRMNDMRPEDTDDIMDNAHIAIDDIKEIFHSLDFPSELVRKLTSDLQLLFFKDYLINLRSYKTNVVFDSVNPPENMALLLQSIATTK